MRRLVLLPLMLMSAMPWLAGQSSKLVDERNPKFTAVEFMRPEGLLVISREERPDMRLKLILRWNSRPDDGVTVSIYRGTEDPKALHQSLVKSLVQSGREISGQEELPGGGLRTAFRSGHELVSACCDSRLLIHVIYRADPEGLNFDAAHTIVATAKLNRVVTKAPPAEQGNFPDNSEYEKTQAAVAAAAVRAIAEASLKSAQPAVKGCSGNGWYRNGNVDLMISGAFFAYYNGTQLSDSGNMTKSSDGLLLVRRIAKRTDQMRFVEGCALQDLDTKQIFSPRQ